MSSKIYFSLFLYCTCVNLLIGQKLTGRLLDNESLDPIQSAVITELNSNTQTLSDADGRFTLELPGNIVELNIQIKAAQFETFDISLNAADWNPQLQEFYLIPLQNDNIQSYDLVEIENDDESSEGDVYSLLTSSEDPIQRVSAFHFGNLRYRLRGIPETYHQLGINGFLLNNPVSSYTPFYLLSGQNMLTRYSEDYLGYKDNVYDFGTVGLAQWIQADPQNARKGFSINYARTNRNYSNRLGAHLASGIMNNGWSFFAGANKRWAQEGFVEGSFYDAWGAYLGVSKSISQKHNLSLLLVNAPVVRGKTSPGTKEVYELNADNYYNSYWGFQEGEKRNSRQVSSKIPMALLNYNWTINEQLILHSGIMGLSGNYSNTRLDHYNALDPRPDYYQKLPSYIEDPVIANEVAIVWRRDVNIRQINWSELYNANYNNIESIRGVNGNETASLSGRRAVYWIEETHRDPTELEHFLNIQWTKKKHRIKGGYRIELAREKNYLRVNDLLGADFMIDVEDFVTNPELGHPDIRVKNHVIYKGDKYGYHYTALVQNLNGDLEYGYAGRKIDFSLGGSIYQNALQRDGKFQNAVFANSLGESETVNQNGYGGKAMITWKFNGRNYIRWNGAYQKLPNRFDQVFINPQWRADILSHDEQTKISFSDLSYFYRSPRFKFQLTGYYVKLEDQIVNKNFYLDEALEQSSDIDLADGSFINAFYTGLDEQHIGVESAMEWDLGRGFDLTLVYNLEDHIYTSRPEFLIFDKYSNAISSHTIYLKNFYVPASAQQAINATIKYNFKRNGFAELSFNYLDRQYLEPNPLRRIEEAVEDVEPGSELYRNIIDQEKLPSAFFVNAYIYKSFPFGKRYLGVSLSINNLLNAENIISGGFEQFRFDYTTKNPAKFPAKYYYLQDINFYLGLTWRL